MGTEGEQAVLEEDPPALLSPRPLPFDQLGLPPLFFHLSRSAQTREEVVTRDCPTFRRAGNVRETVEVLVEVNVRRR